MMSGAAGSGRVGYTTRRSTNGSKNTGFGMPWRWLIQTAHGVVLLDDKKKFVLFKCCFVSFSFCLIFSLCVNETSVGLWGKWAQLRCPPVDAAGTTTAAASAAATTVTVSTVLTVAAAKNLMLTYIHITITCGKFPWLTITRYWYDVSTQGCRSGYI